MQAPLLPRIASGDCSAIDDCIARYGGLVWSLARRLSPSVSDAEDAVQEIFVDLWRNAARFRAEVAEESTFVAMLARRRLIDRLRKLRREPIVQSIDEAAAEHAAPPLTPPVELAEDSARATACLERLRQDERQVLELAIYHGLPQTRIAEYIGIPVGTVKTHARRGLSRLRDCMRATSAPRVKGVAAL